MKKTKKELGKVFEKEAKKLYNSEFRKEKTSIFNFYVLLIVSVLLLGLGLLERNRTILLIGGACLILLVVRKIWEE